MKLEEQMSDNEKVQDPEILKDVDFNKFIKDPKEQLLTRVMLDQRISQRVVQCIPLCSSCNHPYDINLDGSDLPGEVGKSVTVKCSNCGTEYEIAIFRSNP
jgi:hypothetical protein